MEQEFLVTFMKKGKERTYLEGSILDNKEKIFSFEPDIITTTRLSEKELEALKRVTSEYVQKILELYI